MGNSEVEADLEAKRQKLDRSLGRVCDGGLIAAVEQEGHDLLGLSIKTSGFDVLVTLRGSNGDGVEIAFVASDSIGAALRKAYTLASRGELHWRPSKF